MIYIYLLKSWEKRNIGSLILLVLDPLLGIFQAKQVTNVTAKEEPWRSEKNGRGKATLENGNEMCGSCIKNESRSFGKKGPYMRSKCLTKFEGLKHYIGYPPGKRFTISLIYARFTINIASRYDIFLFYDGVTIQLAPMIILLRKQACSSSSSNMPLPSQLTKP